jgi:hypothetical protein
MSASEAAGMPPPSPPPFDPTRDAAVLLRRTGVLVLMVGLPLSAPLLRIGPVLAYVIGTVMLLVAASLETSPRALGAAALTVMRSTAFAAAAVAVGWAALSLAWTPTPGWRHDAGLAVILGLAFAGIVALPERMRASNLYPMPVGAGALALAAVALGAGFWTLEDADEVRLERTLAILVLFAWPSIAWLRSRGRDIEAVALALGTAVAASLGPGSEAILALALGAVAHLVAQFSARGAPIVGLIVAGLLLLAPGLLALSTQFAWLPADWAAWLAQWHDALLGTPLRLLTGHGLGALAARSDGVILAESPVLALWYELGIVGVVAVAVAVAAAMSRVPPAFGRLAPGIAGGLVTAFVLGASGIGGGALWWPAVLATAALLFVAARRGQFRTRRPRALSDLVVRSGAR